MVREFLIECAESPTLYHALDYNPRTGKYFITSEASRSESADEYFGEHGILSRCSILSASASNFFPGPEDGYEWIADSNGNYVMNGEWDGTWACAENLEDIIRTFQAVDDERDFESAEEAIAGLGLVRFSVDSTDPVDGWNTEQQESEIEEYISNLREQIESKIEEIEEEEDSE